MNQRIVVAVEINGKDEIVAEHFGRCSKFKVCELDVNRNVLKRETYFNPLAGEQNEACQIPDYVKQFNVNAIIAGEIGQKAISKFTAYGIDVITAPGVEFNQALNLFIQRKFKCFETCNLSNEHHH